VKKGRASGVAGKDDGSTNRPGHGPKTIKKKAKLQTRTAIPLSSEKGRYEWGSQKADGTLTEGEGKAGSC